MFAISPQVPLLNNFPLTEGKLVVLLRKYQNLFLPAEFTMANLFASLLRLATAPCACRSLLFTFAHNVSNVMRGRRLSLRHSVKHYETVIICIITSWRYGFVQAKFSINNERPSWVSRAVRHRTVASPIPSRCKDTNNFINFQINRRKIWRK